MNLYFNIDYQTVFGEELVLNIVTNNDKGECLTTQYRMNTVDGLRWICCINKLPDACQNVVQYFYCVDSAGVTRRKEWALHPHRLSLSALKANAYHVYDQWHAIPEDAYQYTSAFTQCLKRRNLQPMPASDYERTLRLVVRAPQLRASQRLVLVGDDLALGAWALSRALPMAEVNDCEWVVDLNLDELNGEEIAVKFVAVDADNRVAPLWETGYNRELQLPQIGKNEVCVYQLHQAFFELWDERFAGTLVPVFSLRTKRSFGVGDFGDLKAMIDFVAQTNQRVLQVLPINDSTTTHTWTDSYPYSCISIFALHPQYVDLNALPLLKKEEDRMAFEALRQELNALSQIDYERVNNAKTAYLKLLFEQEGKEMMKGEDFKKFFEEESRWLVPYAQYCYLRDLYGTADFTQWPDHNTWDEAERKALSTPTTKAYKEVAFHYFVQYLLYTQMRHAHEHACAKGVILKGDIPIGVNRHGCDVWTEPHYFNLDGQAGAPPDDFSVKGQNWGFPTYNWDEMLRDGCAWWVRRFQNMAKFFDAYRIDHVLGFFRIWEIPVSCVDGLLGQFSPSLGMSREEIEAYGLPFNEEAFTRPFISDWVLDRMFGENADNVKATYLQPLHDDIWQLRPEYDTQRKIEQAFEGKNEDADRWLYEALWDKDKDVFNRIYNDYYYRRNNQFWYYEAMKKLPKLVEATRMLVCAEDLGMVPDCVAWVMNELRILSLEVQSMPKDPRVRFGNLSAFPYRSVNTFSSHDMPTLRQWWDENWERTQEYYNTMLYKGGPAPHPLSGFLAREIVLRQLLSPSMLCILSIQDWLSTDEDLRLPDADAERINIPANPRHYWRYRMHLNIEDLMANTPFRTAVKDMVQQSGR